MPFWHAKWSPQPPRFLRQQFVYALDSIPGRPQAHAANLIAGPPEGGVQPLYCAWFCGTREGNPDVAILFAEGHYQIPAGVEPPADFQVTYGEPRVIADVPDFALGNPVLFLDPAGVMHLWFAVFQRGCGDERQIWHQTSADRGAHWSDPSVFSDRGGLWVKNAVQVLQDGTWLLPMNDEATWVPEHKTRWSSRFAYSADQGRTWAFTPLYSIQKGMIQPSVVEFPDGRLLAYNRTRNGRVAQTTSADGGRSWSPPTTTPLPNNNSNVSLLRLASGDLLLAYNPVRRGRSPISIARSTDGGATWTRLFDLRTEPGAEFSYPCLIQTPDGLCHVVYTHKRRTIVHDTFVLG
jgi:predicted neuraminidase